MTLRDMVRADFAEFVKVDPAVPEDLRRALRTNERVPGFIDRLAQELQQVEDNGIKLDRLKIKMVVYELTATFVGLLKHRANEMEMSDIAKSHARRVIQEQEEILNKFDKDGNADFTEEYGFKITDKV